MISVTIANESIKLDCCVRSINPLRDKEKIYSPREGVKTIIQQKCYISLPPYPQIDEWETKLCCIEAVQSFF